MKRWRTSRKILKEEEKHEESILAYFRKEIRERYRHPSELIAYTFLLLLYHSVHYVFIVNARFKCAVIVFPLFLSIVIAVSISIPFKMMVYRYIL